MGLGGAVCDAGATRRTVIMVAFGQPTIEEWQADVLVDPLR